MVSKTATIQNAKSNTVNNSTLGRNVFVTAYRVCQKTDTYPCQLRHHMSYKLKNTRYLHCLNNFNIHYYWFIELCAQCVHPAAVQPA